VDSDTQLTLCSLVMPIYNPKFDHFCEAIGSLISQSYINIEIIIVSDGHSKEIDVFLKSVDDSRIRLIVNEKRLGFQKSLNLGLTLANGEIIGRMDSDDVSMPQRIEKQMAIFRANKDVYLVGSNTFMIGASSTIIQGFRNFPSTDEQIRRSILTYNTFAHSAVTFRRSVILDVGLYNESVYAEDYEFWLRILQDHKGYNIPEYQVKIRNSDSSMKITKMKRMEVDVLYMKLKMIGRRKYPINISTILGLFISTGTLLMPSRLVWFMFDRLIKMGYFEQDGAGRIA